MNVTGQPTQPRESRGGGWDPREALECWLGFWKLPGNRASFLTAQRGCEHPHFTAEKSEESSLWPRRPR